MVCWLALCLGRKVEERLGKKCQGEVKGKKETEGEEGGKVKEGQSYSIGIISEIYIKWLC